MKYECRICFSPLSNVFVDLGTAPLSNAYLTEEQLLQPETYHPLVVYVCSKCQLVQLPAHASPETIFGREYLYFSGYSKAWVEHTERFACDAIKRFALAGDSFIVEVASNDGTMLQHFKKRDVPVLGVEPAPNVAKIANDAGIPTRCEFFGQRVANEIVSTHGPADLLFAANVIAHVPDLHDFLAGVKTVIGLTGTAVFEFPHLLNLIERTEFDTIYHEHFSYFSMLSLEVALERHELVIVDVEDLPTHGGSLRVYVHATDDAPRVMSVRTDALRLRECAASLNDITRWMCADFQREAEYIKNALLIFLLDRRAYRQLVAGFGAPAKANTLFNYAGIRRDLVSFVVDDNPHKQGRFMPGSRIPIWGPDAFTTAAPDAVLILPWNLMGSLKPKVTELAPNASIVNPVAINA
jgi:hypothetical protein